MPHLNLKYFSDLSEKKRNQLACELANVVVKIIGCNESVVSIALEPIEKVSWYDKVYVPEIINQKNLLYKIPRY